MKVNLRKAVATVLFTTLNTENRTIISWNDLTRYLNLLKKESDQELELVDFDCENKEDYEQNIICQITDKNVFFAINPKIYHDDFNTNLIDKELILNEENTKKFTNFKYNKKEIMEAQRIIMNDYRNSYLMNIGSLDEFLGKCPWNSIPYESLVAIYMLEYSRLYGNEINKQQFEKDISIMTRYLKSKNINVTNAQLGLFRITCWYPKDISIEKDKISIDINDIDGYINKTINYIDCDLYNYIKKLTSTYIIDTVLDPEKDFSK